MTLALRVVEMAGMVSPSVLTTYMNSRRRLGERSATRTQLSLGSNSVNPASTTSCSVAAQWSTDWSCTRLPSGNTPGKPFIAAAIGQLSRFHFVLLHSFVLSGIAHSPIRLR